MVTEKEMGEEVNGKNIISSFYCLGALKKVRISVWRNGAKSIKANGKRLLSLESLRYG